MEINLKALSQSELLSFVEKAGYTPYRARQIISWIYKKRIVSFEEMSDLPKSFRKFLQKTAYISNVSLLKDQTSGDGSQKFLFELEDQNTIESVLIPDAERLTLCISSQVGCSLGCEFCATGKLKLKRNLKAHEIIDQILAVQRFLKRDKKITNIVFMGMGEPLLNFTEVVEALWRIVNLIGFSQRRVTLSTVGIIPKIAELAKRAPKINLAVSLNATTDEVRNNIMPINKKYPLKKLINSCKNFRLEPRKRITFAYVLLNGINDSSDDASRLIRLLSGIKAKVNLIPYNPVPSNLYTPKGHIRDNQLMLKHTDRCLKKPPDNKILLFQKTLLNAGITATLRKSNGADISAACGQLGAGYLLSKSFTTFKSS
jgi:23S rRNA (adenine2503-C2)-methyltransferase